MLTATFAISSAVLLVLFAASPPSVRAGMTAFSGSSCDGGVGADVACDGGCNAFDDRHSFRVDSGSGEHCVSLFAGPGCPSGEFFILPNQNGQCTNVNTGTNVRSFRCSSNNVCID